MNTVSQNGWNIFYDNTAIVTIFHEGADILLWLCILLRGLGNNISTYAISEDVDKSVTKISLNVTYSVYTVSNCLKFATLIYYLDVSCYELWVWQSSFHVFFVFVSYNTSLSKCESQIVDVLFIFATLELITLKSSLKDKIFSTYNKYHNMITLGT